MSRPEQTAADLEAREGGVESVGVEPRMAPPPGQPADAGHEPWEGYDLAILDAVLDS
jgi:hypothetical protein